MALLCTGQHPGRATDQDADTAVNLPVRWFNHMMSTNSSPALTGKSAVGQSLHNSILYRFIVPRLDS